MLCYIASSLIERCHRSTNMAILYLDLLMKHICEDCIKNEELKQRLILENQNGDCSYCSGKYKKIISSDILIKFGGDRLINSLYSIEQATPYEVGMFFEGVDDINFQEIGYIIQDLQVGNEIFEDELAEYVFQTSDSKEDLFILDYGEHSNNTYKHKWLEFTQSTAHKHRFFNKEAKIFLDSLFELILDDGKIRENVITTLNNSTELFRARIANDEYTRKKIVFDPASQLGPVPASLAGEQRMTPTGISSLYCALERDTCFSEVRAITGDIVFSGCFKPIDNLHFLDLTKIHTLSQLTVDPFSENFADFSNKSEFIRDLMTLMSKPASRNSSSSYLSTQIIFEYLSVKFGNALSGLIFKSVQTDGKGTNVVLFPEHSQIIPSGHSYKNIETAIESQYSFSKLTYYYSISKDGSNSIPTINPKAKMKYVDGSLELYKVKAVVTSIENIPLEIVIHE